jgi:hypothetical protein
MSFTSEHEQTRDQWDEAPLYGLVCDSSYLHTPKSQWLITFVHHPLRQLFHFTSHQGLESTWHITSSSPIYTLHRRGALNLLWDRVPSVDGDSAAGHMEEEKKQSAYTHVSMGSLSLLVAGMMVLTSSSRNDAVLWLVLESCVVLHLPLPRDHSCALCL